MSDTKPGHNTRLLIFSDLDGTLLDGTDYSYEPALPAITALTKNKIPLIFCTSKTKVEIEPLRSKLNNSHPFISENGGAVHIPREYFSHKRGYDREDESYLIIELGTPYTRIREILGQIQLESGVNIRGFGDLHDKEVALFCDFSEEDARRAKQRDYDEPFFLEDKRDLPKIKELAALANLQISQGGRFFHLMGKNDKGKAVRRLTELYDAENGPYITVGIGDSINDRPMLANVNHPLLLQKSVGCYEDGIELENLVRSPGMGPSAWQNAILGLLDELGIDMSPGGLDVEGD